MSIPATNRSLFNQSETQILERGLHTMTVACNALTDQVDRLKTEVQELTISNNKLKKDYEESRIS